MLPPIQGNLILLLFTNCNFGYQKDKRVILRESPRLCVCVCVCLHLVEFAVFLSFLLVCWNLNGGYQLGKPGTPEKESSCFVSNPFRVVCQNPLSQFPGFCRIYHWLILISNFFTSISWLSFEVFLSLSL